MKYQFNDVEFNQQTIVGYANGRPFIADYYEVQAYTTKYIDVYEDISEYESFIDEYIDDVDFWESLLKYLYETLGDEYGKVMRYLESGE